MHITAKCIGKEAIAEMFETIATGDTSQEAMLKYFPTAFNYFENYIKGASKMTPNYQFFETFGHIGCLVPDCRLTYEKIDTNEFFEFPENITES